MQMHLLFVIKNPLVFVIVTVTCMPADLNYIPTMNNIDYTVGMGSFSECYFLRDLPLQIKSSTIDTHPTSKNAPLIGFPDKV